MIYGLLGVTAFTAATVTTAKTIPANVLTHRAEKLYHKLHRNDESVVQQAMAAVNTQNGNVVSNTIPNRGYFVVSHSSESDCSSIDEAIGFATGICTSTFPGSYYMSCEVNEGVVEYVVHPYSNEDCSGEAFSPVVTRSYPSSCMADDGTMEWGGSGGYDVAVCIDSSEPWNDAPGEGIVTRGYAVDDYTCSNEVQWFNFMSSGTCFHSDENLWMTFGGCQDANDVPYAVYSDDNCYTWITSGSTSMPQTCDIESERKLSKKTTSISTHRKLYYDTCEDSEDCNDGVEFCGVECFTGAGTCVEFNNVCQPCDPECQIDDDIFGSGTCQSVCGGYFDYDDEIDDEIDDWDDDWDDDGVDSPMDAICVGNNGDSNNKPKPKPKPNNKPKPKPKPEGGSNDYYGPSDVADVTLTSSSSHNHGLQTSNVWDISMISGGCLLILGAGLVVIKKFMSGRDASSFDALPMDSVTDNKTHRNRYV